MNEETKSKLVRAERNFYFVGAHRREVIFSVAAQDLEGAWAAFRASPHAGTDILFIIKAETEIYLAQ